MAACVASLLRLAKEILLIDPHFGPENGRHRRPLEAFLVVALEQRHGEPPTRVEIHTSEKSSVTFFMSESQRQLPDIVPEGMRIRLVRWRQKDGGEKLHNRYILTDIGGVKFEVRLDDSDGADGQTEGVALLGSEEYQLRLAQYGGPEPAFDFVDELIIEGKHLLRGKFGGTRSNSLG